MPASPRVRLIAAAVLGLAAGTLAWSRVAPMDTFLDLSVSRVPGTANPTLYDLSVVPRGDDPIESVEVGVANGPVRVVGRTEAHDLARGRAEVFRLEVEGGADVRAAARVEETGHVSRTHDVAIGGGR